ncbi:hypothetical protein F4802DRAFT_501149 [Xylaria palmicola]|nr:hypothetical protein F4802DRAFT_501149 [Xylaria palmicola]
MAQQSRLLSIPRELRDNIYERTFAGSAIRLRQDNFVMVRGSTKNVNILFTCRRCYDEGIERFWTVVVVHCNEYIEPEWPRAILFHLGLKLGPFARSRIRHIRGAAAEMYPNRGLALFPELRTCEFFTGHSKIPVDPDIRDSLSNGRLAESAISSLHDERQFATWLKSYAAADRYKTGIKFVSNGFITLGRHSHMGIWQNLHTGKEVLELFPDEESLAKVYEVAEAANQRVLA